MTTVAIAPDPILQFFSNSGQPNAGGTILTQVGGVNTATYQDSAGAIPLPNPIPLNSRGEISNAAGISCQLFLQAGIVYTFTLYDANGNQLNQASYVSVQNGAGLIAFDASGATVYPAGTVGAMLFSFERTATEVSASVTPTNYAYAPGNVLRYGADPTNTAESGTALNNAFASNAVVTVVPGTYKHAVQLVFPNKITIIGSGWLNTQFNYTGVTDQAIISNPINSSTDADIHIEGIYFNGPNIVSPHGNLWDTCSSCVTIERCFFNAGFVGLILDQSELWSVRDCYFAGTNGVWFVNGPDRNIGESAFPYYTNRIKFDSCQFNVTGVAIADDGGNDHHFHNCNLNTGTNYVRACGVYGLHFLGGEYESSSATGFSLVTTKWVSGVSNTVGTSLSVSKAYFATNTGALFTFAASSCPSFTFTDNTLYSTNALTSGLGNCGYVLASGNVQQDAAGTGYTTGIGINNVYDGKVGGVTWGASGTAPSLAGAGSSLLSVVSRVGRKVTVDVVLTAGAGTTFGTGYWEFGLPTVAPTAQASDNIGSAYYACAGGLYVGVSRLNLVGGYVQLFAAASTANAVGPTVPASWAASNANYCEFSVSYLSNDWMN